MHQTLIAAINPGQYTASATANYWPLLIPVAVALVASGIWGLVRLELAQA